MHIPDGYLSPSTCATLYAASTPFWYAALRRVKATLSGQTVPLVGVFSAFSFVIMMFNLPLPGGTTGHAVGMAIAAIVLGPEIAIIAISMALLIQALFFGDGGITAFGANCFNMAVVGSLVAYAVYRLISGHAALHSPRRVLAAGLAGYAAINASALCAAIEFGVQPLWFHDASGRPLYAPFPLSISIPAMMLGHLTIAGSAEMLISAGLVRYLQRTNVALLGRTPAAATEKLRGLWAALGLAVMLTPLGILAAGNAWGEWKIKTLWNAPIADYAPSFTSNAQLGYALSALIGVSVILLLVWGANRLFRQGPQLRRGFVEKTLNGLLAAGQEALFAEDTARRPGLLQKLDPRVKIAGLGSLMLAAVAVHRISALSGLFLLSAGLAVASRIPLLFVAKRVWLAVLAFTGVIALPAILLSGYSALLLVLRAETTATLALLLMLSTPWNRLLRGLRFLGMPVSAVAVASLTYRYIFVFFESAKNMLEARQTRLVGRLTNSAARQFAAAGAGALLEKTIELSGDVHLAMQARGFRGEVRLLDELRMQSRDWWQLAALLALACTAIGLGR